jgi:hypothetical protein
MIILIIIQTLFIVFSFGYMTRRLKRCEPVSWRVKRGDKCYSCLEPIGDEEVISLSDKEDFRLCRSCERDEKLSFTLGSKRLMYMNRLKRFCHSDKSHRANIYFAIFLFLCIILSVVMKHFAKTDIFTPLSFVGNIIYWSFFVYRSKICFAEKDEYRK